MKSFYFLIVLILTINSHQLHSQIENLNKYKYAVVNDQFEFVKKPDQYKTSSLTKFLMEKIGFETYLKGESLPHEIRTNRCKALFVDVVDKSGLLSTKSKIQFKDCNENLIFETTEGRSKMKQYDRAYYDAINKAYTSFNDFVYRYVGDSTEIIEPTDTNTEKKVKPTVLEAISANTSSHSDLGTYNNETKTLYAQPNTNGYQLVDTSPKIVFTILKTSNPEVFIVKNKNALLTKKNNNWIIEYYKNNVLKTEVLNIKF